MKAMKDQPQAHSYPGRPYPKMGNSGLAAPGNTEAVKEGEDYPSVPTPAHMKVMQAPMNQACLTKARKDYESTIHGGQDKSKK